MSGGFGGLGPLRHQPVGNPQTQETAEMAHTIGRGGIQIQDDHLLCGRSPVSMKEQSLNSCQSVLIVEIELTNRNTRKIIRGSGQPKIKESCTGVKEVVMAKKGVLKKDSSGEWTFFSNYGHVLFCLALDSTARLRDIAEQVGITERAAQRIVADLERGGIITRIREGRRNRYELHHQEHLRHPLEERHTVGELIALLEG
jgi:DNA-binding transcriptional ArsR family regulator